MKTKVTISFLLLVLTSFALAGSWHEDYNQALQAMKSKNWQSAVNLLNSAISQKSTPKTRAKTYGLRFIDYLPYTYRGIAHYYLGEYDLAQNDLKKSLQIGAVRKAKRDRKAKARLSKHLNLLKEKENDRKTPTAIKKKDEQNPVVISENVINSETQKEHNSQAKVAQEPVKTKTSPVKKSAKSGNRLYNSNIISTKDRDVTISNAFDDEFKAALTLYNDGEFRQAKENFLALEKKSPNKYETQQYLERINRVEKMVRDGITAYFEGDHDLSITQLNNALKNNFVNADVHAFLGCAYAAKYLLQGAADNSLRVNAVEQFTIATRLSPEYNLDQRYISPSIINLFSKRN